MKPMENRKFRPLPLLAAALLLLSACAHETEDGQMTQLADTETSAPETEAPLYTLPEADFGGEACNFYVSEFYAKSFAFEEIGEKLNDAQYRMVKKAEDALNVTVTETEIDLWQQLDSVRQLVMAGDTEYDVISMHERFAPSAAMEGLVMDISDIDSIALGEPWWGGKVLDTLALGDRLFFGIGAFNLATYQRTACLLMNTTLAASVNIEIPYDDVFAGTWTWDDVLLSHSTVTQDLNGDGVFTMEDRYNLAVGDNRIAANINYIGMGANILTNNGTTLALTMFDDERLVNAFEMTKALLYSGNNNVKQFLTVDNYSMRDNFIAGNSLYYQIYFMRVNELRDMKDDYAILPIPKYSDEQDSYYCRTDDSIFQMIPTTQEDPDMVGTVLDSLACIGYYDLLPVYVDTVVKEKLARDDQSKRSLDICFETMTLDLANTYLYSLVGSDVIHEKLIGSSSFSIVSFLESKSKQMERAIRDNMKAYDAVE